MAHDELSDNRNINRAEREWESAITFSPRSNVHSLVDALLSQADEIDDTLDEVYHDHHIDTATGEQLDAFGRLVSTPRQENEGDERYRTRIKANLAAAITDTDYDSFVQFTASVFDTNVDNITVSTNYDGQPATATVSINAEVLEEIPLSTTETVNLLGDGVPAGHSVNVQQAGTFRLKADGDPDTSENGLTSDSIETGGTLAEDLVQ